MSSSDIDQPAGRAEAGRAAGGAEPTKEERAAAAAVLQMIWGIHISRAVYVVAALGIADLLAGGPMTAAQLAQATQAHERSLYRVLRLLASLGVLTEHDHRSFSLTILGERLRADVPASMRSWALLVDTVGGLRSFEPTIEIVKTGKPGPDIAYGMGVFEFLAARPDLTQKFQAAMSERTAAFAPSVAAGYDFSPLRTVADIGGGKGTLLAAILRAHGHLRGVLFDRPSVVAAAAEVLWAAGVADRCEIVPGDFFQGVPDGADAYLLANVLHDWDDADSVRILGACRRSMAKDGRVLVIERLIPDDLADAVPVLLSDLTMLVVTGGQERTNAEYGQLLDQAGLSLAKVQPVAPPYGVIEALPS
jgi:ubiquinone/menaquinone biosynthesis C-methylase UbiE